MKKKIVLIIVVIALIVMLIPIKQSYKDGGTVSYQAVLYGVERVHRMSEKNTKLVNELSMKLYDESDSLSEDEIAEIENQISENEGFEIGTVVRILFFNIYDDTEFVSIKDLNNE